MSPDSIVRACAGFGTLAQVLSDLRHLETLLAEHADDVPALAEARTRTSRCVKRISQLPQWPWWIKRASFFSDHGIAVSTYHAVVKRGRIARLPTRQIGRTHYVLITDAASWLAAISPSVLPHH